jgi:hypothetical protein
MSNLVDVKNGLHLGLPINGVFKLIDVIENTGKGGFSIKVESGDGIILVDIPNGAGVVKPVSIGEIKRKTQPDMLLTELQVADIITERFEVLVALTEAMMFSDIKSLLISGAAGIGKTFHVTEILEAAERLGQHWGILGGRCTAFGLYEVLYEYRNEGSILVLDDVAVFEDENQINILKKALDSSKRRFIDWRSASKMLEERGIPQSFEFKGKVIFLTNTNIYAEIATGTKRAPHLEAFVSRSCVLDLGIHDVRTILIHVRNVVRSTGMLINIGLTHQQQEEIIQYLTEYRDELAALSLRTPLLIAEFVKHHPDRWRIMANHTLLTAKPLRFVD